MKVAVIGAGWAGCAAAVEAVRLGDEVTLFESSRTAGGRARGVQGFMPGESATPVLLDNGQHILIGAYAATLGLMADLGVDEKTALLRLPLTMLYPDGSGIRFPSHPLIPAPIDALAGIMGASGWTWRDRLSLLRTAVGWQLGGFKCQPHESVASLCRHLSPGAMAQLIEPLCVSALNTPPERASGQVFLRVMRDALFSASGASNLLLPRQDLGALLPDAALAWLKARGAVVLTGQRVQAITKMAGQRWRVNTSSVQQALDGSDDNSNGPHRGDDQIHDRVILACPPGEAARLCSAEGHATEEWLQRARDLTHEAITTVYAHAPGARLPEPMLTLRADANRPAQFVFDRGQLGSPAGLLAFVVSASQGDSAALTQQVLAQGKEQLRLTTLAAVQTIVEKRATFACTPGLERPGMLVAPGLLACGDYVDGPYPATLEGAVLSGLQAAQHVTPSEVRVLK